MRLRELKNSEAFEIVNAPTVLQTSGEDQPRPTPAVPDMPKAAGAFMIASYAALMAAFVVTIHGARADFAMVIAAFYLAMFFAVPAVFIGVEEVFHRVVTNCPNITTALWWVELVSKSIHREWIINVGQRSAPERIAHLLCEMFLRLESVGLTDGFSCDFPLTQNDIAATTGLTSVHVNRTIQELRRRNLIVLERHRLTIPDMLALQGVGLFNPDYLHIRRLDRHTDRGRRASEARVQS